MKRKKVLIIIGSFLVLVLLIIFNIQSILKFYMGMKDPEMETKESIYTYAKEIGMKDSEFYVIDSSQLKEIYKGSFPKVYFFNEAGDMIIDGNCFGALPELVDTLKTKQKFKIIKSNFLPEVLTTIKTFDGDSIQKTEGNSQFTIVYYWAKWMGSINKTKLKALEERIKNMQELDIRLIKVNADIQKSWGMSEEALTRMFEE